MKKTLISLLLALPLLCGCGSEVKTPDYYIVGYFPSYNANANADNCWWDITHVNLSFVKINADGSINDGNVRRSYPQVAAKAKEHNVKMMVSLGGGGPKEEQDAFAAAVLDDTARENIIKNVMGLVNELGLDGVDIDYEAWNYPKEQVAQLVPALEKLFTGFRKALGKKGLLSSAVAIYGLDKGGYTKATMESMDYMTIMAYDLTGWSSVMGPHSPFSYAVEGCEKALANGAKPAGLNPLQQSAADTNANVTAIAGAVQDLLTAEARGDLFANIQNVVTGKMTAEEAIASALALN